MVVEKLIARRLLMNAESQLKDYSGIISHYKKEYGKKCKNALYRRAYSLWYKQKNQECENMNAEEARKFEIEKAKRHNSCVIGISFCVNNEESKKEPTMVGTTDDLLKILSGKL